MKLVAPLSLVSLLATVAFAHPGAHNPPPTAFELARRSLHARAASNCHAVTAEMKARRMAKRNLALNKRNIPTSALSAASAQATALKNTTCVLSPQVTEGPYYVNGELLRTNVVEDQPGVPLALDIGLIDIATCTPLENVMVEIWHANVTGSYSYFAGESLDQPGGGSADGGMGGGNGTMPSGGAAMSGGAMPSGMAPSGAASAAMPSSSSSSTIAKRTVGDGSDDGSFFRGGYPTNANGLVEFQTMFPGFYTGRAVHIHVLVRKDYEIADDGSIVSDSGTVLQEGQVFFDEDVLEKVLATTLYSNTTQTRTYNSEDSILQSNVGSGYSPYADITFSNDDDVFEGAYGYITLGIDVNNTISITSTNTIESINPTWAASALAAAGLQSHAASASQATGSVAAAVVTGVSSAARRFKLF
ncbi:hypothetical protein JCM10212_004379 [Sporobolomyces blumeae]